MIRMGGFGRYRGLLTMAALSLGFCGSAGALRAAESAAAGANLVQVRDVFVQAGQTAVINIDVTNSDLFKAFQFNLTFSSGLTFNSGSAILTSRSLAQNLNYEVQPDGSWLFLGLPSSSPATPFSGSSGAVMQLTCTASGGAGTYSISIFDAKLIAPNNSYLPLTSASGQVTVFSTPAKLRVKTKMEGWGMGSTMGTTLSGSGYLPLTSPYAEAPRVASNFPLNTTDWILLELRTTATGGPVWQQSFFVNQDGNLLETNGVQDLLLGVPPGSYWIVLRHRNHAAVMSAAAFAVIANSANLYDFTFGADKFYGGGGKLAGSRWAMPCGDINQDGLITSRDYVAWYRSSAAVSGYYAADLNGDGGVTEQDRLLWRANAQAGNKSMVP